MAGLAGHALTTGGFTAALTAFVATGVVLVALLFAAALGVATAHEELTARLQASAATIKRWGPRADRRRHVAAGARGLRRHLRPRLFGLANPKPPRPSRRAVSVHPAHQVIYCPVSCNSSEDSGPPARPYRDLQVRPTSPGAVPALSQSPVSPTRGGGPRACGVHDRRRTRVARGPDIDVRIHTVYAIHWVALRQRGQRWPRRRPRATSSTQRSRQCDRDL